ncbi:hypothetical protein [Micromonospora sp. NPDC049497]|uniref:hypothetical protein n=1 Tax=Micromonospora sp. NPDC049497 TaxID=3364273 RepID=UPI0037A46FE0
MAVYAPVCTGDTVAAVQVEQMPDVGESGDVTLIWDAEQPTEASVREGLIVLGTGFATVRQAPPAQFAGVLSVAVDTTAGRRYSAALPVPDRTDRFPAGTPLTDMSFVTEDGTADYTTMRAHFSAEFDNCG